MQKRHAILGATVLILVIIGCAIAAFVVWRQQQGAASLAASVPEIPDLSRWPETFAREVRDATEKARSDSDPVGSLSRLAQLYLGNSYVAQAKQPLAALCRMDSANAQWRYLLADAHMRLGETNAAETNFEETTKLDPNYSWAWIRLGFLRTERGDGAEAHECYVKAAAAHPNDLMFAYLQLEFEARSRMSADILQRVENFARAHPGYREPHPLLADLYDAAGDGVAAAKERRLASATFRQLPNVDPWLDHLGEFSFDADRLRTLSLAAFSQGRLDSAEQLLKRGIQIAPTDPLLWDVMYSIYEKMGRPNDALRTLQEAVVKCPDDPNLRVQLSRLLCSLNRPGDAVTSIQQAVQHWPSNAALRAAFGFALSNAGKKEAAVTELQQAIHLDPTLVEERYNLAVGLLALGKRDEARAAARKALEMRPDYADPMAMIGVFALEDGDLVAAEPTVNRFYTLQPDDAKAQSLFCSLQLLKGTEAERAGNFSEAKKAYEAGLAVAPKNWRLLRAHGLLAIHQGNLPDAIEDFRGYLQAKPDETEAYFMLGEALQKTGQTSEGRSFLERGLKLELQNGNNYARVEAFKRALQER